MADSKLTPLQRAVLDEFFRRESDFFLTGGGALAGFHLGHRTTKDLDLFSTVDERLDGAERTLSAIAASLQGSAEATIRAPDFRRWVVRTRDGAIVVDLVRDRAPQIHADKQMLEGIRVDPPDEILANKLSALMGRSELRDLVDVRALELAGNRVEDALRAGSIKDASLTPAQLGWVLSQITLGDEVRLPAGVSVSEMRSYLADLVTRLARMARP